MAAPQKVKVIVARTHQRYADYCREHGVPHNTLAMFVSSVDKRSHYRVAGLRLRREDVVFLDTPHRELQVYLDYTISVTESMDRGDDGGNMSLDEKVDEILRLLRKLVV